DLCGLDRLLLALGVPQDQRLLLEELGRAGESRLGRRDEVEAALVVLEDDEHRGALAVGLGGYLAGRLGDRPVVGLCGLLPVAVLEVLVAVAQVILDGSRRAGR